MTPNLGPLFTAVSEQRPASLRYNDRDRTIDPYRLDFQRGRWYLTGFDRGQGRGAQLPGRSHRRCRRPSATPALVRRPETAVEGGAAQPWQFGEGDPVTARLLGRSRSGRAGCEVTSATNRAEERHDGSLVFRVAVTNWPAFRSFVLTFLEHAEILSPPELRDADDRVVLDGRDVSRLTADDRMRRMLSIIPWVAAQRRRAHRRRCAERFQIDRKALVADFEILSFVGVYPYTPDTQIDAVIEGDMVYVHLPQWFDRPLRLTPEQGMSLVASAQSLVSIPGADPEGPLARGIDKIATSLGVDATPVEVTLGTGRGRHHGRAPGAPPSTTTRSRSTTTPTAATS